MSKTRTNNKVVKPKASLSDVLAKTKVDKAKSDKVHSHHDESLKAPLDRWVAAKRQLTNLKAELETIELSVLEKTRKVAEMVVPKGKQSIVVNDSVRITFTERYSGASICPAEYSDMLKETRQIALKKEVANDDALLTKVIEALGADLFAQVFESKIVFIPQSLADYFKLPQSLQEEVHLAKPSFREV